MGTKKNRRRKSESDSTSSSSSDSNDESASETNSSSGREDDSKHKKRKHSKHKKVKHSKKKLEQPDETDHSDNEEELDEKKSKSKKKRSSEGKEQSAKKPEQSEDDDKHKHRAHKKRDESNSREKYKDRPKEGNSEKADKRQRSEEDYRSRRYRSNSRDRDKSDSNRGDQERGNRRYDNRFNNRRGYDENRGTFNRRPNFRRDREDRFDKSRDRKRSRSIDRRNNDHRENKRQRSRSPSFDHKNAQWGKKTDVKSENRDTKKEKEKPNFSLSGKLTEERNTYRGVVIKYSEPPEARKPKRRWRLYPFKGEKAMQTLYIHRESAYLIGRDRKVVDLPVDHPSCSKQHAALQYRLVPFTREDGTTGKKVRPYLIDLDSANGTYINNKRIEPRKYVELLEKDVIKFGYSSREYVLLHENSKDEAQDDDVKQEDEVAVKKEQDE